MIEGLHNLAPGDWAILYANGALEPDEVTFVEAELQKYPELLAKVEELREFNKKLIKALGPPGEGAECHNILAETDVTPLLKDSIPKESSGPPEPISLCECDDVPWNPIKIETMATQLKMLRANSSAPNVPKSDIISLAFRLQNELHSLVKRHNRSDLIPIIDRRFIIFSYKLERRAISVVKELFPDASYREIRNIAKAITIKALLRINDEYYIKITEEVDNLNPNEDENFFKNLENILIEFEDLAEST